MTVQKLGTRFYDVDVAC
uniref:Uncharacterized protein n=1 Tax=Lepeophtheirus salmonis TaxID=72036 RepID=A0A0K2VAG2_LEPSM